MLLLRDTLVYKRDHEGDPDESGVFGCNDCMGRIRQRGFAAVIGIGGQSRKVDPTIRSRVNWIGIGPHKYDPPPGWDYRGPLVVFDRFLYCNAWGGMVRDVAPALAARMYDINVRATMRFDALAQRDIRRLLAWAADAPRSPALTPERLQELTGSTQVTRPCARRKRVIC